MDHEKLRTASTYLNNLLLVRGLLRNGDPIDFVKPSKESRAQIINLVHDQILREDREKEQRDHAAATIRALRAEDARKSRRIERLVAKGEESARASVQAQTAERTALAEVKKVEKALKAWQDQTAKLKTSLAQVKTQCTKDVRKRDLELARLKTHLQGQQRGNRVGMTAPSMTVRQLGDKQVPAHASKHDLRDPEYSLKQETTDFLTQLSQSLSDENDSLISLIRGALGTMRELLGLPANSRRHPDSAVGSMGSEEAASNTSKQKSANSLLHTLPTSYEALAADMESTVEHLKTILTNPNFVSLEEVEVRDEEIVRLREGWEYMEQRWRDVLRMMDGWRRRMDTGDTINLEDLRKGMGLVSPDRARHGALSEVAEEQSLIAEEASELQASLMEVEDEPSMLAPEPPKHSSPVRSSPKRKRDALEPPEFFDLRPSTASRTAPTSPVRSSKALSPQVLLDDDEESEILPITKMSIEEKLRVAQTDAEEAASARESSLAAAFQLPREQSEAIPTGLDGGIDDDTLGKMPSPMAKKTKIRGRPRKRKSTLSPDELEALIRGDGRD